jgi:hypothetical protein
MLSRITLAGTAALGLLLIPSAHAQTTDGWEDHQRWGSVTVSADRRHIEVCDLRGDHAGVKVEYTTSMLITHTATDSNGAEPGCETDHVWFGRIDVFTMCRTGFASGGCNQPIWIKRR